MMEARRKNEVWKIVNRERRRVRKVDEGIRREEWEEYFMGLLGDVWNRVVREYERGSMVEDRKEDINRREMKRTIRRLKDGKAAGIDGLPEEVWRYGGKELERWAEEFLDKIWRGEGWPESWRKGLIVTIVKRGERRKVADYRGITLMPSMYKLYRMILAKKLREEMEGKGVIPQTQTGFRKGMGTIDIIHVLNYVVNKQIGRVGRRYLIR